MRFLAAIFTLTIKELRLLLRDKQAAALLFGMPTILILILSLALEDIYGDKVGTKLKVSLALHDEGDRAKAFRDMFYAAGGIELVARPAAMADSELFRTRAVHAVVRIPPGFSSAAEKFFEAKGQDDLGDDRIEWTTSPTLDASYRWFLQSRLAMACAKMVRDELAKGQEKLAAELEKVGSKLTETAVQLESAVTQLQRVAAGIEGDATQMREMALAATAELAAAQEAEALRKELGIQSTDDVPKTAPQSGTVRTESKEILIEVPADARLASATTPKVEELQKLQKRGTRQVVAGSADDGPELFLRQADSAEVIVPTPLQQTVPGWALFAMFFLVVPLAQGLHRERMDGSTRRILSLAVPRSAIVLGKLCPYVLVGLLQFGAMLAVGLWVVPLLGDVSLEMGAQPLVLVPIALACSLAATSYAMLVATWARTAEQAAAFGATSVVILSVLGGVMVPHFMMPQTLQDIAVASPIYWGHKACLDAFLHGASLAEVADSLTFLGGFALVCMVLSVRRVTH